MGKINTYKIIDRVGSHDTAIIEAANGRAALKKFLASHMMSTGIYECIKDGITGIWFPPTAATLKPSP